MADIMELDKAVGAHGMWKARLKMAIDTGTIETAIDVIRKDNQCVFGKWLSGPTLTATDRHSDNYLAVRNLHAEFHRCAGRVAELALAGRKAEAERMIALGGEYAAVSGLLTKAMMEWKRATVAA